MAEDVLFNSFGGKTTIECLGDRNRVLDRREAYSVCCRRRSLVILFTLYLLLTPSLTNEEEEEGDDTPKASVFQRKVDRQIHASRVRSRCRRWSLFSQLVCSTPTRGPLARVQRRRVLCQLCSCRAIVAVALPMPMVD